MNYIISLKHTRKDDECITLWRPDDNGYTWFLKAAGEYHNPEKGYHDNSDNMPVSIEAINSLSILKQERGKMERVIPNTKEVWLALNQPEIASKF